MLKHLVLVEIITYLQRKEAAFDYIDTHAGAGLYHLHRGHSQKLAEYREGIGKLFDLDWLELNPYLCQVKTINPDGKLKAYPGSPMLALSLLRPQDRAWLYELHPTDFELLCKNVRRHKKVKVLNENGFKSLPALLPPASRRGLVLIDPPYEVKSDFNTVVRTLQQAHRRFATGIYALWYPVVDRRQINWLEGALRSSGIPNMQRFELGVCPDSSARGMTSSGMVVVNPTWGLFEKMQHILPTLATLLGQDGQGVFRCDVLAEK